MIWTEQDDELRWEKGDPGSVIMGERVGIELLSKSLSSTWIESLSAVEDNGKMSTTLGTRLCKLCQ